MEPQNAVKQISHHVPVAVHGQDEHGRTLVGCPTCGDTATVLDSGEVRCPTGAATDDAIQQALGAWPPPSP